MPFNFRRRCRFAKILFTFEINSIALAFHKSFAITKTYRETISREC